MPCMRAYINQVNLGVLPTDTASTMVFIIMYIRNTGQPSIADHWTVRGIFPDGRTVIGQNQFIQGTMTLSGGPGTSARTYHESDALYAKALNPIPTGGMIRGVLMVYFQGMDQSQLAQRGTKIVVEFEDVFERRYSAMQIMTGDGVPIGQADYYPMRPV